MDDRAKALQAGNEVGHGSSGLVPACGIALQPDGFINPPAGLHGRAPALRDRSPQLFAPPSPECGVIHPEQIPNSTGRREQTYEK